MKYFIITLALLIFPLTTNAASGLIINLLYSEGTLSFDNPAAEQNKKLYISSQSFDAQSLNSVGPFTLLITDWNNNELVNERFNTQLGKFSLSVPYYSTLKKLTILETKSNKSILEKDLSFVSTCNTNNICEFEKGEDASNCLLDCGVSQPKYSKETEQILKAKNGIITDANGKILLKEAPKSTATTWAIVTIIIIAGAIATFIIIRRKRYGR